MFCEFLTVERQRIGIVQSAPHHRAPPCRFLPSDKENVNLQVKRRHPDVTIADASFLSYFNDADRRRATLIL